MGKASLGATLSGFSFKNSTVGVFPIKKDVVAEEHNMKHYSKKSLKVFLKGALKFVKS